MKINIPATKTNLIQLKKTLTLTQEGYDLLDEKRRILMSELSSIINVVSKLQKDVDNALKDGYELVAKAEVLVGQKKMQEISLGMNIRSNLSISAKRIMGVSVPLIHLKVIDNQPYFSSVGVGFAVDEVIIKFKEIIKLIIALAEKKIALLRLAQEAKKTIRKVNALDKIYLPYYKEGVKYIGDRLDEEARDAFSLLKIIKEKLAQDKQ